MGELAAREKREWSWEQHRNLLTPCCPDLPYYAGGWFIPLLFSPLTGEGLVHSDSQGMNSGSRDK